MDNETREELYEAMEDIENIIKSERPPAVEKINTVGNVHIRNFVGRKGGGVYLMKKYIYFFLMGS